MIFADYAYTDRFWCRILRVIHKALGRSLCEAGSRPLRYTPNAAHDGREKEVLRDTILTEKSTDTYEHPESTTR